MRKVLAAGRASYMWLVGDTLNSSFGIQVDASDIIGRECMWCAEHTHTHKKNVFVTKFWSVANSWLLVLRKITLCAPTFVPFFVCFDTKRKYALSHKRRIAHNGNMKNQKQWINGNCQSSTSMLCKLNARNFVAVSCSHCFVFCSTWIMFMTHEWCHSTCTTNRKRFANSNMQDKYLLASIAFRFRNNLAELFHSAYLRNLICFSSYDYELLVEFKASRRNQAFLLRFLN